MPMKPFVLFLLALLCLASVSAVADDTDDSEENYNESWSQWYFSLGATWPHADGTYRLEVPGEGEITVLDFDSVGLRQRDTSHWLSANWRSRSSRWGAWFANWHFDATGSQVWGTEVGPDIPIGAELVSDFNATFYILEGTYSFYRNKAVDVGVGFGFHAVELDTGLVGRAYVGDFEEEFINTRLDVLAPLPNVVGYGAWKFANRWALSGRVGWFGLSYSKYSGDMVNMHATLDFEMSKNWMASFGYQFVSLDVDIDETEDEGFIEKYDIDFDGPMFYISLKF